MVQGFSWGVTGSRNEVEAAAHSTAMDLLPPNCSLKPG